MRELTSSSDAHVTFSGVTKRYDSHHMVVRHLDLDIAKGEFLTLLGPSGCGKTTILMMLAGFESPTTGVIMIDGTPIHTTPPQRRNIGMVFQSYALFPHMTVAENVGYGLKVRGVPKEEIASRVDTILETMHLAGFADRKPGMLSGGQQQRTALARALVFAPSIVLMDEPLGALDKSLREHLQLEIRQIADRFHLTVVYVTHDQYEALTLSDRIAIFNDGRIQQLDTAQAIYARPANRFVAGFVGDNNCIVGEVIAIDTERADVRIQGGHVIQIRRTDHVQRGSPTTAAIRPEGVRLTHTASEGAIAATVMDVIFCGDQIRTHVQLQGGVTLLVKTPAPCGELGPEKGQAVFVHIAWTDAWALDGE